MITLRNLIVKFLTVVVLCVSCPKIYTHLTVISLKGIYVLSGQADPQAINSCLLQPLVGWLLHEKLTLVIESILSFEDFERKSSSEENPNTYKPKVIEHQ